jgi:Uma2 family endonuclease
MIATLRPLTYGDLLAMPDDGQRYEIIGGELIVTPAPMARHQRVLLRLIRLLDDFLQSHDSGELFVAPFDIVLGPNDVVEPDLLIIASDSGRVAGDQNTFKGAPTLVVEILSPSSRRTDLVRKMALYARSEVAEYWIADPEQRTLFILVLEGAAYRQLQPESDGRLASRALPGLRFDPAAIFAGID